MAKKNKKTDILQEIRSMSEQEIQNKIEESGLRLKKMAFSHAITPIENPMAIRTTRREIARLQTELKRKQSGF